MPARVRSALGLCAILALWPQIALAQISFDMTGARALGMGGAFVAVADDPTAVHWNPAALVRGGPAGLTIGADWFQFRNGNRPALPGATRQSANLISIGTWPLGLSFGSECASRITQAGAGGTSVESLSLKHLGVTVLQTVFDTDAFGGEFSLVAGATVKFSRGTARIAELSFPSTIGEAFDVVSESAGRASGTVDLDIGLHAEMPRLRAGVTFKNLRQPRFHTIADSAITVKRRARLGVAFAPRDGLTFALDVDLDTADPLVGLRRVIALGGESRLGPRLFVRGGVRWQREADRRPAGALGASVLLRPGFWLDGYFTPQSRDDGQGFGMALRVGL
jgi:hypothetical protein